MKTIKCECGEYRYPHAFFRDGEYQSTCNACYKKSIGKFYYKDRKNRKTNKCCRCGSLKDNLSISYCSSCLSSMNKERRKEASINSVKGRFRLLKKEILLFIEKIESNDRMVTLEDINDIITFYSGITKKLSEFDSASPGMQIQMMYNKLLSISGKNSHF